LTIPGKRQENLCFKACNLMLDKENDGVLMHLHKLIPPGSGLGGGSSDAAHTLLSVNEIFNRGLPIEKLIELAGALGSDCPFFLLNQILLASGKGDIFKQADIELADYEVLLILPDIHVSTQWAYSQVIPGKHMIPPSEAILYDIDFWQEQLINDFEGPVFKKYPILRKTRDRLYKNGALYSAMSGSGSAIFGIFQKIPDGIESEFQGMRVVRTTILQ
jgi:4-diphosphocytidyl-2-C-methyl-D-erythritol kinase